MQRKQVASPHIEDTNPRQGKEEIDAPAGLDKKDIANILWHLAVLGVVSYDLWNNPNANLLEYGTDLAVHALQIAATYTQDTTLNWTAFLANTGRAQSIYELGIEGVSSIPKIANSVDLGLNHIVLGAAYNIYTLFKPKAPTQGVSEPKPESVSDNIRKFGKNN